MKQFSLLYKTLMTVNFRKTSDRLQGKKSAYKNIGLGVLALPLIILLCFLIFSITSLLADSLDILSACVIAMAQIIILFFGILSMVSNVYLSKDNEFLAGLPIKSSTVFLAKFAVQYTIDLIISAVFLIPAFITLAVSASMAGVTVSIAYYLLLPVVIVLTPVFPLAIIAILSFPMMYLVSFFKGRSGFINVVSMLLFLLIFGAYYAIVGSLTSVDFTDGEMLEQLRQMMLNFMTPTAEAFYFNLFITRAMTSLEVGAIFLNLLYYLLCAVGCLGISYILSSFLFERAYRSFIEIGGGSAKAKKRSNEKVKVSGRIPALMKKDFKSIVRDSSLCFNALMPPIFLPIVMVFIFLFLNPVTGSNAVIGFSILYGLIIGTVNIVSITAVSRERESFYQTKSLPITPKEYIQSKLLLSNLLSFTAIALIVIVCASFMQDNYWTIPLMIITLALYAVGMNRVWLLVDLSKPKLHWTSLREITKNNSSTAMVMIPVILIGIGGYVYLMLLEELKFISYEAGWAVYWAVNLVLALAVFIVSGIKIKEKAITYLNRIE